MWWRYLPGLLLVGVTGWAYTSFHIWNVTDEVTLPIFCSQLFLFSSLYYLSVKLFREDQGSKALWFFLTCCLVSRAILVFAPVVFTGDMPRYLWEGLLVREGVNPYLHAPRAEILLHLRTSYWADIEYPHLSAIYPPVAEYFLALFAQTELSWKFFLWISEAVSIGLILLLLIRKQLPLGRVVYYAALPVSLLEISGSGHLEGVLVVFFLLFLWYSTEMQSLKRSLKASFTTLSLSLSMAFAFLIKYVLVVAFALFGLSQLRRGNVKFVLVLSGLTLFNVLLLFSPFLLQDFRSPFDSLITYVSHWRFNDSLLHLFGAAGEVDFQRLETFSHLKIMLFGIWIGGTLSGFVLGIDYLKLTVFSFLIFFLCSAVVHPWYVLWYAPILCFVPSRAGIWFAVSVSFAYLSYFTPDGSVPVIVKVLEYGPMIGFLIYEFAEEIRKKTGIATKSSGSEFFAHR